MQIIPGALVGAGIGLLRSRERDDMHANSAETVLGATGLCYDPANGMTCMQIPASLRLSVTTTASYDPANGMTCMQSIKLVASSHASSKLRSRERDDMHANKKMVEWTRRGLRYDPANGMTCMQRS